MELIVNGILYYLDHLQDVDYLAAIVNSTSSSKLCNIIVELLQSKNAETVHLTCLFVRDLILIGSRHPDSKKFVQEYPESPIVKILEQLLLSDNHFTRKQAVYTLGKTCNYSSLHNTMGSY
ncbi:hypothetical protein [Phormidesmis sp. 146-33]